ncbi:MAG: glycosyltransferase [Gemmatimonadales bacterium]
MPSSDGPAIVLVIPCYNEERRLRIEDFRRFAEESPQVRFGFVDDGSTDGTLALLEALAAGRSPERSYVVHLEHNEGKAEAVRQGMLRAFDLEATYAGYWDADLATPLSELGRLVRVLDERPSVDLALGSRQQLPGHHIERNALRSVSARVFGALAARTLCADVYDTMCGAKLFRATPEVQALFDERFIANWPFDVEILARWIRRRGEAQGPTFEESVCEVPLRTWREIPGSKVRPGDCVRAMLELWRIWRRYLA